MKKVFILSFLFILSVVTVFSQKDTGNSGNLNGLFKKAGSVFNSSKSSSGSSLGTEEIVAGLKEALAIGAKNSSAKLSATDGFLKDAVVKILLPEEVRKVEPRLRAMGMGKVFDQAIESLNRAAEDASRQASPIFIDAIKKMTVQDGLSILKGSDTAATAYLKKSTSNDLTNAFRPVIESSLKKVDATKYWKAVFTLYNRFAPMPVTADINEYVTDRALKGIFYYVGEEEKKIRENPAARVTEILKTVFGK